MKAFLIFAFLLSLTFGLNEAEFAEEAGMTIDEALDLVEGILNGLDVNYEIEHIKDCFAKTPPLIKAIKKFIEDIKAVDWKDIEKVFELFASLFGTLKDIMELLKPCAGITKDINLIIEKIKKINFENLMKKIMENIWELFTTMTDCIRKFEKKDYKGAGEDIGTIVYKLLLEDSLDVDQLKLDVEEFFKGFFKGLGAENEYENIRKCITDVEKIIIRIVEAIKKIATLDIKKVIEGVTELIAAVTELIKMVTPCLESTSILKKLIEKIINVNIMALVWKIIGHIGELMKDINLIIEGFGKKNYYNVGLGLGGILKALFLD